jgi:hypothetical protein
LQLKRFPFLQAFPSSANFVLFRVINFPAQELALALRSRGILVGLHTLHPFHPYVNFLFYSGAFFRAAGWKSCGIHPHQLGQIVRHSRSASYSTDFPFN